VFARSDLALFGLLLTGCGPQFNTAKGDDTASTSTLGDGGTGSGDAGNTSGDAGNTSGDGGTGTPGEAVDYCHLQWPCSTGGAAGTTSEGIYVWVFEDGATQGAGAGAGLIVQVGVGPDASDPATGDWTWADAAWDADKDGLKAGDMANDEFMGTFSLPSTAGLYDYCGRASADGGVSWLYCDLALSDGNGCWGVGSDDGYSSDDSGTLIVK